jgi:hypothetical protein
MGRKGALETSLLGPGDGVLFTLFSIVDLLLERLVLGNDPG